jgi:tetratricopeptide (TPR) repeat protein
MKKWMIIAAAAVLGALAGCQKGNSNMEARAAAYQRWYRARATVLCGVSAEYLKSGQLDNAVKSAREAIALDQECTEAHRLLGKAYIEQGQYAPAMEELGIACRQKDDSAESAYLLGVAQEKAGRLGEALASYRRARQLDETHVDAVVAAGEVLVQMDRLEEAQSYIEFNLQTAGECPAIYELAGRLAMMRKEFATAAERYQRACDMDVKNLRYVESLAQAHRLAGQYERAVEVLTDLAAREEYARTAWVHTMLGDCLLAMDRPAEAREAYYRAKDIAPDSAEAWVNLAKALLACRETPRAAAAAREAVRLQPDSTEATGLLGYALLSNGQVEEAMEVLAGAVGKHPSDVTLQCLLGRAHELSGDEVQAGRCYAAAMDSNPRSLLARELAGLEGPSNGSRD